MCKIGRFKLFLQREINNLYEFSCTRYAVCVHVTCTVVTVHAICKGLMRPTFGHIPSFKKLYIISPGKLKKHFCTGVFPSLFFVLFCFVFCFCFFWFFDVLRFFDVKKYYCSCDLWKYFFAMYSGI